MNKTTPRPFPDIEEAPAPTSNPGREALLAQYESVTKLETLMEQLEDRFHPILKRDSPREGIARTEISAEVPPYMVELHDINHRLLQLYAHIENIYNRCPEGNNHYDQGGFSVWDIIKAFCPRYTHLEFCAYQGYLWGNIVKYILRCGWKENLDGDLEKAANYLQRLRQYREQLLCQKKSNAPAPDAAVEAGTTTEKESGSASTVTEEDLLLMVCQDNLSLQEFLAWVEDRLT